LTATSANYFTGSARADAFFHASAPARVSGARVAFEAGARAAWHTHPLGQTLIVRAKMGRSLSPEFKIIERLTRHMAFA